MVMKKIRVGSNVDPSPVALLTRLRYFTRGDIYVKTNKAERGTNESTVRVIFMRVSVF